MPPSPPDNPSDAARILESITDAFFALDRSWRFTYVNAQAERLLFRARADLLGRDIWEEFPAALGSAFEREYRRAAEEQVAAAFEEFYPPLAAWFEVRAFPSPEGLSVFFHDITERVGRRRHERFLADLAERARMLTDPDDVIADAVRSVGEFLGVSRCLFADIDIEADTCSVPPHYRADDSVASIAGVFPISAFGPFVVAEYKAGRTAVVDDVSADPTRAPPESLAAYEAIGVRAYVAAPVLHSARLVSSIAVHSATARHWEAEEIELLQTVVERTWLTVEVTRQNRALVRVAEERREAHERTATILESITGAFYALDSQWRLSFVNHQAEALWGRGRAELLGQPFLAVFPNAQGSFPFAQHERVMAERVPAHFETLSPILGRWVEVNIYPTADGGLSVFFHDISARKALEDERSRFVSLANNSTDFIGMSDLDDQPFYVNPAGLRMVGLADMDQARAARGIEFFHEDDRPFILSDLVPRVLRDGHGHAEVRLRHFGTGVPIWVNYTLLTLTDGDGRVVGLATVSRDISERKALEAERERLAEREHNIAQQLQSALQPEVPRAVPGLRLAKYYEAALAESEGVGGDFYDVFALEKGCTVLAVGDLSGKGLSAAAQVATVRNMLRAFLYTRTTLAEAVTELNRVLALNDLLSAFATLWVGCYDGSTGELAYINCGQEPALLRRTATGVVEQLLPTGPVLGADANASFQERTVALWPGDALAVFTDGATECGPSRREMLGIEGVAALLAPPFAPEESDGAERMAEAVALRLVEGVDAASRGGVARDDICILVAVAEGVSLRERLGQV